MRNIALCSLVLLCSLWSFTSSVRAQECTPVVYAFRHAEDGKTPTGAPTLTADGVEHADLYPNMVSAFEVTHNYCPVGHVYSMYNVNADKMPGTSNPFLTASPLAYVACLRQNIISLSHGDNPCIDTTRSKPLMHLSNDHYLYECFGNDSSTGNALDIKGQPTATSTQLLAELLLNAQGTEPFISSAIFWTSEGLHTLGEAIATGTNIPKKGAHTPPRNAVYVLEYHGGTFNVVDGTPNLQRYLQCFNINPMGLLSEEYYCKRGDIQTRVDVTQLQGKVCDTTTLGTQGTNGFFPTPCQ